jgi:transposase
MDEKELWHTYVTLTEIEAVFRSLKSELGLRPIYHHKEKRIDAHLFLTLVAYTLVHTNGINSRKREYTTAGRRSGRISLH